MSDFDFSSQRELPPDAALPHEPPDAYDEATTASLREAAANYRHLFENSHDPVLILSPEEVVLDVNEVACRVYGLPRERFIGFCMKEISIDAAAGERQVARVLSGENVHFASRQTAADGRIMELEIHAVRIPYGDGFAILSVNRDVTEERRRQAALRQSEREYRELFDAAPVGIFRATSDDQLLTANRALLALLGYSEPDELIRKPMSALFVDPVDVRLITKDVRSSRIARREVRLRRRDGSIIWAEVHARDAGRSVMEAFVTDITERRTAQQERETLVAEMHLLLQSAYEGICASDAVGRCTLANAAAARMFGYEPEEIVGRPLHELSHHTRPDGSPYPREECPLLQVMRTGQPWRGEEMLWRSDGSGFPAEVVASPIVVDGRVTGIVASFLDITERKATERQLETSERVAGLGRLAATVAHEFNNVLMAILPLIEVLERRLTDAKLLRLIETMKHSVDRGKGITQEILRFTQRAEPIAQQIEVGRYLAELREELIRTLASPGVRLQIQLPGERLWMMADPSQLQQVFTNLALNARDAMAGEGTLTITARREDRDIPPCGRFVHFEVADTGPGMSDQIRRHAFDPLFTTKRAGTGLGLAVVHQVVEAHAGEIFVDSAPGRGARFHLLLPMAEPPQPAPARTPARAPEQAGPWRVLLVEDDAAVSSGLATLMTMEGMQVDVVDHGGAAVAAVEHAHPDVVVLDVGLPDMSGTSVYQALTQRWPELPVVFVTGHADGGEIVEALPRKAIVTVVQKPFSIDALIGAIHRVIRRQPPADGTEKRR